LPPASRAGDGSCHAVWLVLPRGRLRHPRPGREILIHWRARHLAVEKDVDRRGDLLDIVNAAGAPLTQHEDNAINESIFEHDDTYMVVGVITDGVNEVHALKVHQVQGQGGVHVIDFLGFYGTREAAEDAVKNTDYFVYESF